MNPESLDRGVKRRNTAKSLLEGELHSEAGDITLLCNEDNEEYNQGTTETKGYVGYKGGSVRKLNWGEQSRACETPECVYCNTRFD